MIKLNENSKRVKELRPKGANKPTEPVFTQNEEL
jgi:hypothetical protein